VQNYAKISRSYESLTSLLPLSGDARNVIGLKIGSTTLYPHTSYDPKISIAITPDIFYLNAILEIVN